MYKLIKSPFTGEINSVLTERDGVRYQIPFNPDNTDYQAYLRWLEAGNTPTPAEENQ